MPKILLPITGTKETITRPVVAEVVRELINWTGLPANIKFQLPGDKDVMHQPGSSIDPQSAFGYYDETTRLFVTFEEQYDEEFINTMAVFRPDYPHFYFDGDTRTFMRSAYSRTTLRISVRYQATDKGAAERWRDEIRTRIAHERHDRCHNVTYSYLIPNEFFVILKEIHRLRENKSPYGEDYETYFKEHVTKRATILTDQGGKNKEWAVREHQAGVNGYFDFDFAPEKGSRAQDGTSWNIQFDYVIRIDKPIAAVMMYELVVHNQELDSKYRDVKPPEKLENYELSYSMSGKLYSWWASVSDPRPIGTPGYSFPLYDQFVPSFTPPHTLRLLTCLVTVDETDNKTLINLNELGPFELSDSVLDYVKRNLQESTVYGRGLVHISVYEFDDPLDSGLIEIDSDLNIKLKTASDLRKIYHVRISIYTNPLILPAEQLDDLCSDYDGTYEILSVIAPTCLQMFPLNRIGDNYMSLTELRKVLECRYKRAIRFPTEHDPVFWSLVTTLIVQANRTKEG